MIKVVSLFFAFSASAYAAAVQYEIVGHLPAGDGGWDFASVDPARQRLYLARTDGVTAIDLRSGRVTERIVGGNRVHAALPIPGTNHVIATNGAANNAVLFDGRTGRIRATLATGTDPDAAVYDPATGTVWIMNAGSGDATVIDPEAARVLATVPVGGALELGAADGHGRLYVNVEDRNETVVIDTKARAVIARFPLANCEEPTGIAYDPRSRLIVSACYGNAVAVISTTDGRRVASLPIGKGADGAVFDERRRVALVPAGQDGTLTLIRLGKKPRVIGTLRTAVTARTIALDSTNGRAYLPSAVLAPSRANADVAHVPGSFRVLVVAPQ